MKTVTNTKRILPDDRVMYRMSRQRYGVEYRIEVMVDPYTSPRYEIAWALRKARREMQCALDHIQ